MSLQTVTLGEICLVRRGATITEKQALKGNIPVVAGGVSYSYTHAESNRSANVITVSASGANAGYVNFWDIPIFASDCSTVEPINKSVDIKFIFYFLKSKQNFINQTMRSGAAQPHVYAKDIAKISLVLPPLLEQQRIAAMLDKAALIERKRELTIEKLDLLAESIFEKIENSKEFLDFPVIKLGDVLELQRGGSPRPIADWITEEEDGINWIKISDATASDKYIYECKQKIKKGGERHSRMVHEGDFLLSNSMSFGRPYILKTSGCIHDGWLVLRDSKHIFEQDYLYSLLSSPSVKRQFIKFASGAVVKNLNIDAVSKVEIRLLDKKAQLLFSKKVEVIERYKKQLKDADTLFNKFKNSLHQSAFSEQL